jgi:tetratricopeptide (TPR) repeat protein
MTLFYSKKPLTMAALMLIASISALGCGENRVAQAHREAMEAAAADTVLTPQEKMALEANALKNEAMDALMAGNASKAASLLKKATDLNPIDHNLWYQRGMALIEIGNNAEAYSVLTKAIQLNPRHGNTYKARGKASLNMNKYDEAIADLNLALEISPRDAHAYVDRGLAKVSKGQRKSGCDDFGRAEWLRTVNVEEYQSRYCGA